MAFATSPIFEKKTVMVTGGAGFLGSHLCEALLKEANVICVDDFSNSSIQNIQHLLQYPDFEFIKHDVTQPIDLEAFPELQKFKVSYQGVQEVYHMACPTSPKNFEDLKLPSLKANSYAMVNTLDLAVRYRAKYIFSSSAVVYGDPAPGQPYFDESHQGIVDHLSPRACYNEGKRFAETCVETYRQAYGLDAKIARVFTTYGPRMRLRDGLLLPDFILDAIEGRDLVIYGDETLETSLCYVSDMVEGLMRLMKAPASLSIVNLGSDQMIRLVDIAQYIIQETNSTSQIRYEAPLAFLSKKGIPNLKRAKEQLSWIPLVQVQEGIRQTIDYTMANKERISFV